MVSKKIIYSYPFFLKQLVVIIVISIGIALFLFLIIYKLQKNTKEKEIFIQTPTKGLGLGQCHWIGGPFSSNGGVKWGYSSSTNFAFTDGGGDDWAAIEPSKGEYHFEQLRAEVNMAKTVGKKLWLQIQTAEKSNKEHNVPKWALDEGVETVIDAACGDLSHFRNKTEIAWDNGTLNSVKSVWNNLKYVDQGESVLYKADGTITTDTNQASKVRFPTRIAAVWDPLYRQYFGSALRALKNEFQTELDSGLIEAIAMMSGGESGECTMIPKCPAYDKTCTADVLNPLCPAVISMAKFVQKQHYSELSIDQVASTVVAKKSDCDPANVVPGNKVQLCTLADQSKCPIGEGGSACYVFDDYFIQAVKQQVATYVEIFSSTPVVFQTGSGLSYTGRVTVIMQNWINDTYGNRVWLKFNGWGPVSKTSKNRNFNQYSNVGAHGYEPDTPINFSKLNKWLGNEEAGKLAIVEAIKGGIVADKSSYLCMQSTFFNEKPIDTGNGLLANQYYFNPYDQSPECKTSEINVAQYGVGFCPGFLNSVMQSNIPSFPNGTVSPSPTTTPLATPLLGDVNGDRFVNSDDAKYVFAHWGGETRI